MGWKEHVPLTIVIPSVKFSRTQSPNEEGPVHRKQERPRKNAGSDIGGMAAKTGC